MRVILLGAPGSGKGSLAGLIGAAYGFPKISTGDLLRDAAREKTPLGLQAAAQLGKGGLVDDAVVLGLLRERLARPDCRAGYILDGYPRNLAQAKDLETLDDGRREIVFLIETREAVVIERLSSRRICSACQAIFNVVTKKPSREGICDVCGGRLVQRNDDRDEVIAERMKTYRQKTEPLISFYQGRGILHRVDGNGRLEEIFSAVRPVLDAEIRVAEAFGKRP
jgi:adenylate kinase